MNDRFGDDYNEQFSFNIDTTCCPISKPVNHHIQRYFYCAKCKRHTLKYEVGVHRVSGKIIWLNGPIGGSNHDLTVARNGVLKMIGENERLIADKGYIGESKILTPIKKRHFTAEEIEFNDAHSKIHFCHIERINYRIKIFNFASHRWRHSFTLHSKSMNLIAKLVNLNLKFYPLNK